MASSADLPQLMLLYRQPPRWIVLAETDAPIEGTGIDLGAVESGRKKIVLGLADALWNRLAVAADVLDLVGRALADRMLGDLGAHRDPVDPRRQLDAAVGLDGQLVAGGVQRRDQLGIDLERRLAAGQDHPVAAHRELQ